MLHLTMKAHVRRTGKPVLILGCDSRDAVTIDDAGNLRGYRLTSLKSTLLEAQLRMALDTKGVQMMLTSATETSDDDEYGVEISK
jgi:hypothetical protein